MIPHIPNIKLEGEQPKQDLVKLDLIQDPLMALDKFGRKGLKFVSKKLKLKEVIVFDDFSKEIKKTKEMDKILKKFDAKDSILILDKNSKDKIFRATKNIPNVKCTDIGHFSAYDILKFKKIIFTETSVKELEKRYN